MKDGAILIASAVLLAILGWGFWYFFGNSGFDLLLIIALAAATTDNIRLRRQLRSLLNG
jgi:hypothetical protein